MACITCICVCLCVNIIYLYYSIDIYNIRVPIIINKFQDFELILPTFPINVLYNIKFGVLTLKT